MNDDAAYQAARRRVHALRGFYIHLSVFVLVMAFLTFINVTTSSGIWWVQWPFFGWGIAIAIHAFVVFSGGQFLGPEWERRKIEQILRKQQPKT